MKRHSFSCLAVLAAALSVASPALAAALQPSGNAATDTSAINSAITAAGTGGTVELGEGTFLITGTAGLTVNGVTIQGQGWEKTIIKSADTSCQRAFSLNSGAKLIGLTVTGFTGSYRGAVGMMKTGSSVSWCCFSNNTCTAAVSGTNFGGVLSVQAGTVDHCIITGNTSVNLSGAAIGVPQPTAAVTIDTCLIYGNTSSGNTGGGITVDSSTQTVVVRNCTITGNSANSGAAGLQVNNGSAGKFTMINTIVSDNKTGGAEHNVSITTATLNSTDSKNCLVSGSDSGTSPYTDAGLVSAMSAKGFISGNPGFLGPSTGNYHLNDGSPAAGSGASYSGIGKDLDNVDFDNPPSMGCYKYVAQTTVAKPEFSATQLKFNQEFDLTLTCMTPGAKIYYTVNGADPRTSGTEYTVPIHVFKANTTVKAYATKTGLDPSDVVVMAYEYVTALIPGGSPSSTWQIIQDAIDTSPNGIVPLAGGYTFVIDNVLTINNGASLVGTGAKPEDVTLSLDTPELKNVLLITGSPATVVSNLTVTTEIGSTYMAGEGKNNSGIKMDSGTIDHCIIRNCRTKNGQYDGGGINMSGGTVRFSTITKCEAMNSAGFISKGEAIFMTGGLVECCKIVNNDNVKYANSHNAWQRGGAVVIAGGTLRSCLVADNTGHSFGSGVTAENNAVVENCTIVNNHAVDSSSNCRGLAIIGANVTVRNNIVWGNYMADKATPSNVGFVYINGTTYEFGAERGTLVNNDTRPGFTAGSNNIEADPMFADAANGDYHPGYTDCTDGGADMDWMATALDLDGNKRILLLHVDIGCYERASGGCKVSATPDGQLGISVVTLKCEYSGGTLGAVSWKLTRQQDGSQVTANEAQCQVSVPTGVWDLWVEAICDGTPTVVQNERALDIRAAVVYVNGSGSNEFPYSTPATGSPSIDEAFPLLGSGGKLLLAEGSYVVSNSLKFAEGTGSGIESISGPARTVVRFADVDVFKTGKTFGLILDASDARVSGVTFIGGRIGEYYSGPEYKTYGLAKVLGANAMITNCVFRDLRHVGEGSNLYVDGTGLEQSAGTVVDCTFTRINSVTSGGAVKHGGVIRITGGLADRLKIDGCFMDSVLLPGSYGDVVGVFDEGVLRNSLIARCYTNHEAPVYVGRSAGSGATHSGKLINCTIVANTNHQTAVSAENNGTTVYYSDYCGGVRTNCGDIENTIIAENWSVKASSVSNLYVAAGIENVSYTLVDDRYDDPKWKQGAATQVNHNVSVEFEKIFFRNFAGGDFTLRPGSPAVEYALHEPWMDTARDLSGGPRIKGNQPDLGCYENDFLGFAILRY